MTNAKTPGEAFFENAFKFKGERGNLYRPLVRLKCHIFAIQRCYLLRCPRDVQYLFYSSIPTMDAGGGLRKRVQLQRRPFLKSDLLGYLTNLYAPEHQRLCQIRRQLQKTKEL